MNGVKGDVRSYSMRLRYNVFKLSSGKLSAVPWLLQVDQWLFQVHIAQGSQR
jgi:hypothetical protein